MTDPKAIAALIERAKSAPEGSRELDAKIWASACKFEDFTEHGLAEGWEARFEAQEDGSVYCYAFNKTSDEYHRQGRKPAPRFSTSLDAKLPGENIARVHKCDHGGWIAEHEVGMTNLQGWPVGSLLVGDGKTEPLARRAAALKAIAAGDDGRTTSGCSGVQNAVMKCRSPTKRPTASERNRRAGCRSKPVAEDLERAVRAVEDELDRDWDAYMERWSNPAGLADDAPEIPGKYTTSPLRIARAAIGALMGPSERAIEAADNAMDGYAEGAAATDDRKMAAAGIQGFLRHILEQADG